MFQPNCLKSCFLLGQIARIKSWSPYFNPKPMNKPSPFQSVYKPPPPPIPKFPSKPPCPANKLPLQSKRLSIAPPFNTPTLQNNSKLKPLPYQKGTRLTSDWVER